MRVKCSPLCSTCGTWSCWSPGAPPALAWPSRGCSPNAAPWWWRPTATPGGWQRPALSCRHWAVPSRPSPMSATRGRSPRWWTASWPPTGGSTWCSPTPASRKAAGPATRPASSTPSTSPTGTRLVDVNLHGVVHTLRAAAAPMKKQRSGQHRRHRLDRGAAPGPVRVRTPTCVAKAGVLNLVRQAALDLARWQVRVNAIAPGPFRTNIGGDGPIPPAAAGAVGRHGAPGPDGRRPRGPRPGDAAGLGRVELHDRRGVPGRRRPAPAVAATAGCPAMTGTLERGRPVSAAQLSWRADWIRLETVRPDRAGRPRPLLEHVLLRGDPRHASTTTRCGCVPASRAGRTGTASCSARATWPPGCGRCSPTSATTRTTGSEQLRPGRLAAQRPPEHAAGTRHRLQLGLARATTCRSAAGMALAGRLDGRDYRTFVLTGDGELQEGQVWEAAMAGEPLPARQPGRDRGRQRLLRRRPDLAGDEHRAAGRAGSSAFGWLVHEVDGHDVTALSATFDGLPDPAARPAGRASSRAPARATARPDWSRRRRPGTSACCTRDPGRGGRRDLGRMG